MLDLLETATSIRHPWHNMGRDDSKAYKLIRLAAPPIRFEPRRTDGPPDLLLGMGVIDLEGHLSRRRNHK